MYKGAVLHKCSKFKEAIKNFDKALKLDPEYADAFSGKGEKTNIY